MPTRRKPAIAPDQKKSQQRKAKAAAAPSNFMAIIFSPGAFGVSLKFKEVFKATAEGGRKITTSQSYGQDFAVRSSALDALNLQLGKFLDKIDAAEKASAPATLPFDGKKGRKK
jgi:hypothetical protein